MVSKHQFTSPALQTQFYDQVLGRLRALPGVAAAGVIDDLPLQGGSNQPIAVAGHPVVAMSEQPEVSVRVITPGYLQAMHIPVLQGRDLSVNDTPDATSVVVISQSMAKQLWPHENPIGRHLTLTFDPDRDREVVGIVGDVRQTGLDSTAGMATLYRPLAQLSASPSEPWQAFPLSLAIRTTTPPLRLAPVVASTISQVNKDIPVDNVMTLEDFVGQTLTQQSFNMQLLTIFGLLALFLCTIGIYSVLAYTVKRRMREIGLRVAFGATLRDVARLVIFQGMKPTLGGIIIGLAAALALGRIASSLIYGVSARDLVTFSAVTMLLIVVSFGASVIPAIRATRVDPLTVLREE
jgi:putative ABC transport system permease protein